MIKKKCYYRPIVSCGKIKISVAKKYRKLENHQNISRFPKKEMGKGTNKNKLVLFRYIAINT